MDRSKLVDRLGLVPGGQFSITDIQMVQWGRDMVFDCIYQTVLEDGSLEDPVQFSIVFQDCREIRYKVYAHIGWHEHGKVTPTAEIVEIGLGHGHHRRDANILTNHFAVTISYGNIVLEMDSHDYNLET
jgi:hypothetical protein